MGIKKTCQLCNKQEIINRKNNHHIIPQRNGGQGKGKIWLCSFCHMILHKAEFMGICKLPQSTEEYREWKQNKKEVSQSD